MGVIAELLEYAFFGGTPYLSIQLIIIIYLFISHLLNTLYYVFLYLPDISMAIFYFGHKHI